MRKSVWLLSAALLAVPAPLYAQQANPGQPTKPTGPEGEAEVNQANTAEQGAVKTTTLGQQPVDTGDIVVTATRRNQALSDVPIAVSAVTAENLELSGAHDIRQLNQLSPSLLVSSTSSEGGATVARIRGVGTVGDNPGLEGSVGIFIDGVYRSRAGMALTDLGPLERIEVLRGPQGTLFGRNTSAGLISIITAQPRFQPEFSGELTYGNYDYWRAVASVTGPISSSLAARLDGVWVKRDGFLHDVVSGRNINDRDRWMVRGQLLYEPDSNLSIRIVGDYTQRREECCGATYLPARNFSAAGSSPSTIKAIETALGGIINDDTYARNVSITPGRDYMSNVDDWGVSGEINYDFGAAKLTSITAYRYNKYTRGQDADFNNLDFWYRPSDGNSFNKFETVTQELRLQGKTMSDRLDWLLGAYYANEHMTVKDNITYGADYPLWANCLTGLNAVSEGLPSSLLAPGASPTCLNPAVAGAVLPLLDPLTQTVISAFARLGPFAGAPFTNSGYSNLAFALTGNPAYLGSLTGEGLNDLWKHESTNWALFTHNIFSITPTVDLTVGARYTHEKKTLHGTMSDNLILCGFYSAAAPDLQTLPCVIPTVGPAGFSIDDERSEDNLSGTVNLSWKPTPQLLAYASYSRGYKAGGFNLDRSALTRVRGNGAVCVSSAQPNCAGAVASGADLQFKPEKNDAIELGMKYNGHGFDLNVALFHELFSDFQLNTFNGLFFIVQNINSCKADLGGGDTDQSRITGACPGDTKAGVKSQGVEVEAFTRPMRYLNVNFGVTYADTKYRHNLVGADGVPLDPYLWQLPGRRVSNSNEWTVTGSAAWTPPIPGTGLSALVYADARYMSSFNTGSDLDIEKTQPDFTVVNARVGVRGPNNVWALEFWAQNLFNAKYMQVAFDAPIQGSGTQRAVEAGYSTLATQLYGAFLGEPRTYGATFRVAFSPPPPPPPPVTTPPPPPPAPEAPATMVCPDGTTILATDTCPAPPPPPPPPPPAPERG